MNHYHCYRCGRHIATETTASLNCDNCQAEFLTQVFPLYDRPGNHWYRDKDGTLFLPVDQETIFFTETKNPADVSPPGLQ